jgi:hypothetical protein
MNSNRLYTADLRYDLMEVIDINKVVEAAGIQMSADIIAPPVEVENSDGHIPVKKAGTGEQIINGDRGQDGSYPRFNWVMGTDSYYTSFGGWEIPIDNIKDYDVRRFVNLEEENAQILFNTRAVGKEYRLATQANLLSNYADANKTTITLASANAITGKNLLNMGITAATALSAKYKTEVGNLTAIIGTDAITNILHNLADLKTSQQYTAPMETMPMDARLAILKAYLGVKNIIPVSGWYNSAHVKEEAVFGKLWSQTQIIYALISPGGRWDKSYARQPLYTKPLGGREYVIETYDEPQNDQSITRLKESKGLKMDFTMGYVFEGIFATGT